MFKQALHILIFCGLLLTETATATVLRDPMRPSHIPLPQPANTPSSPAVEIAPAPVALVLSAISYQHESLRRSAIINDIWVKKGVQIEGATVVDIDKYSVDLNWNGKLITLRLIPDLKIETEG